MTTTDGFNKALNFTLKWEGGYSDDPADRGGKTFCGITERTLATARGYGLTKIRNVKELDRPTICRIYKRMFWVPSASDRLPYPLCVCEFDTAVLSGGRNSVKTLQYTLNGLFNVGLAIDGTFGVKTLKSVTMYWPEHSRAMLVRYLAQREAHHRLVVAKDVTQEKFLGGWLNRNNALKKFALKELENNG